MEKLYSVSKEKKKPGDDCGSDHLFFIVKFRLRVKKEGHLAIKYKTIRPFRYKLNALYSGGDK